ncbi:hypothetical protein Sjap_007110 [Stephania japonica]|uniref:Uncharacterized protein n=1 Tax=Stephania japonica TaxID=461633 RepID=A0AAP0JMY9_9MAGN
MTWGTAGDLTMSVMESHSPGASISMMMSRNGRDMRDIVDVLCGTVLNPYQKLPLGATPPLDHRDWRLSSTPLSLGLGPTALRSSQQYEMNQNVDLDGLDEVGVDVKGIIVFGDNVKESKYKPQSSFAESKLLEKVLHCSRLLNMLSLYLYCLFTTIILLLNWRNHEGGNDSTDIRDVERGGVVAIPIEASAGHQFYSVLSVVTQVVGEIVIGWQIAAA